MKRQRLAAMPLMTMNRANSRNNLLPPLAVLGSVVSLCSGSSFAKTLFPLLGAQGVTAFRVGFSALMLLAFWKPWRTPLTKEDSRKIILYGIVLGVMNLCFYMAIRTLPIGVAIAIEFVGPLSVAIFSSRRLLDFLWIACAVAGLALLLPWQAGTQGLDPTGLMFISVAALCWALYIVLGKRTGSIHAGQVTSLGMSTAALVVVPFGIAQAGLALLSPKLIVLGLVVALLSSAVPYSLEMFALKRLPHNTFGILCSIEPAVGALFGLLVLGEKLTLQQIGAIVLIIVASVGTAASIKKEVPQLADVEPVAP